MIALVLEPFNDISVKKLSDEQIIQREMLQQFVEETFGGKVIISLLLVLAASSPLTALIWTFYLSSDISPRKRKH